MIGRFLYGVLFAALLPLGLVLWARALEPSFPLPAVQWPWPGTFVALGGLGLALWGILEIVIRGEGLPMNPYPPTRFVRTGPFRWIDNPIYCGFGMLVAGWALATGSASGLWLVTPTVVLAMTALVIGYERPDLRRRFGDRALERPALALPSADDAPPS